MPPTRTARLVAVLLGLAISALTAVSAAAATPGGEPELQADLAHQMALAGPHDGAFVYDLTAKETLFSLRASVARPPASVEKLYTATAALALFGPGGHLQTDVYGTGALAPGGVWQGNLYLRGGGDPTFGTGAFIRGAYGGIGSSVATLAKALVADGIHSVAGEVLGDESWLDSRRGEPSSGYAPDPFLEGTLSGLAFNRGEQTKAGGAHAPAALAAHELLGALKRLGVAVSGHSGAAQTPATGTTLLAQLPSPTVAQLLGLTLPPSDNFFAETLIKDIGAAFGGAGTTSAGAAVVSRTIASDFGLHPRIVDGSGLSRADHTSPYEVVTLLSDLAAIPIGPVLRSDMAVAGRSGTLALRMRHTGAAGRCQGKTGTLEGASNLAGYCQAADGHTLVFAIFNDGIGVLQAHTVQDHITITIAGY